MQKDLQVENGNYTRIINKVIDELLLLPLNGTEYAVCLFVIRKTWGYQKKEDSISISQFEEAVKRDRSGIKVALKKLQAANILLCVKKGNINGDSNVWSFNKYYEKWSSLGRKTTLGENTSLGYKKPKPRLENPSNLGENTSHTKDNTKDNTKERLRVARVSPKKKEKKPIEVYTPERLEAVLCDMEKKEDSHLNIIATYIREKPVKVENSQQLTLIISRFGKVASQMVGAYTNEQIFNAIDGIKKDNVWRKRKGEGEIDWTVETVLKKLVKN